MTDKSFKFNFVSQNVCEPCVSVDFDFVGEFSSHHRTFFIVLVLSFFHGKYEPLSHFGMAVAKIAEVVRVLNGLCDVIDKRY